MAPFLYRSTRTVFHKNLSIILPKLVHGVAETKDVDTENIVIETCNNKLEVSLLTVNL